MSIERKMAHFAAQVSEERGEVMGYANIFNLRDDAGDIVAPGAFRESLPAFLREGFVGGLNHDWDNPIGRPLEAYEDADGLWMRASISDTERGRDCRTLMRDGVVTKLSIGFQARGTRRLEGLEQVMAYWRSVGYVPSAEEAKQAREGARLITAARLIEVSPVMAPANVRATITGVKAGRSDILTLREFERFLRDAGFSRQNATSIALHGFKGLGQGERVSEEATVFAGETCSLLQRVAVLEAQRLSRRLLEGA